MVPNMWTAATAAVLQDEAQPQIHSIEACSVMSVMVKVPLRQREASEVLIARCDIQRGPCLREDSDYPLPAVRAPNYPPQNQTPWFCFENCVYCHRLDFSRS